MLRACAIEAGLDPDTALPEDILSLSKDKEGALFVCQDYKEASGRAEYYRRVENGEG